MANKSIQVYPTDLTVKKVKQAEEVLMNTTGKSSESSAVNMLILRLHNIEKEVIELRSELGFLQDNNQQSNREEGA